MLNSNMLENKELKVIYPEVVATPDAVQTEVVNKPDAVQNEVSQVNAQVNAQVNEQTKTSDTTTEKYTPEEKAEYGKKVQQKINQMTYEINEVKRTSQEELSKRDLQIQELQNSFQKNNYETELNKLMGQREEAYENNDSAALARIDTKVYELNRPVTPPPQKNTLPPPQSNHDNPVEQYNREATNLFGQKYSWYTENEGMKVVADSISKKIFNDPLWSTKALDDQFDEVARRTVSYFPGVKVNIPGSTESPSNYTNNINADVQNIRAKLTQDEIKMTMRLQRMNENQAVDFLSKK